MRDRCVEAPARSCRGFVVSGPGRRHPAARLASGAPRRAAFTARAGASEDRRRRPAPNPVHPGRQVDTSGNSEVGRCATRPRGRAGGDVVHNLKPRRGACRKREGRRNARTRHDGQRRRRVGVHGRAGGRAGGAGTRGDARGTWPGARTRTAGVAGVSPGSGLHRARRAAGVVPGPGAGSDGVAGPPA